MIGRTIHELRIKKGITLSELAKRANISKSYLSNIERNLNQNPSIQVLEKVASVLHVDVKTLLGNPSNTKEAHVDKEWLEFIIELENLGIQKEDLHEYKDLIQYIQWKNNKKGS